MFFNDLLIPISDAGTVSGVLHVDASATQHVRAALVGDTEIGVPLNPVDGASLELWLNASGGDRSVTLDPSIALGLNGSDLFPWVVSAGQTIFLTLRYDGHRALWFVTSIIGGY